MVLRQASIFGDYKVVIKHNKKKSTKKEKNKKLKAKLSLLYSLYEQLYETLGIDILEQKELIIKNNIVAYPQDRQAEPMEIINMNILDDIDKRIEVMEDTLYNKKIEDTRKYIQLQFDFMKDFNDTVRN